MYLPEPSGIIDKQLFVKEMSIAMRNLFVLTGASLLFCTTAGAWNYPQWEAFAGYNFVRYNPSSGFVPSFNANGGNGQIAYNFNKWFGAVVDAGAATKGDLNGFSGINTTLVYLTAGPRITFNRDGRFQPYAQVLLGGAYWAGTFTCSTLTCGNLGLFYPSSRGVISDWGFALLAGGGVDVKVSKHFYIRPAEASYFLTHMSNPFTPSFPIVFPNDSTTRNNFRYAAGVKVTWGEPK